MNWHSSVVDMERWNLLIEEEIMEIEEKKYKYKLGHHLVLYAI